MKNKEDSFKEKFKQALTSTIKVISDDYKFENNSNKKKYIQKDIEIPELNNLKNKQDFLRIRALADSEALKKKFSNKVIYQNNSPNNSVCKRLYDISEKIRYELLGAKMLKGIKKNLSEHYQQKKISNTSDQPNFICLKIFLISN